MVANAIKNKHLLPQAHLLSIERHSVRLNGILGPNHDQHLTIDLQHRQRNSRRLEEAILGGIKQIHVIVKGDITSDICLPLYSPQRDRLPNGHSERKRADNKEAKLQ